MPEQPGRDRRPFGQGGAALTSPDPPTGRGTVGCAKPGRGFGRLGAPVFPTATARQHTSLPIHTARQTVPNVYELPPPAAIVGGPTCVPEEPHASRLQVVRLRDHASPRAGHHLCG